MVRYNKQRLITQSQTLAFHSRSNHFKGFARTHTMCQKRITTVKHMSNRIFLMWTERDRRVHTLECDMASVIFTGTVRVKSGIVLLHQIRTAGRITENPIVERRFDGILLLLCKHGFLFIKNPLFLSVLDYLIKDSCITEVQRIFQQLISVHTVSTIGHTNTDVSVAITALAADIPFSRSLRILNVNDISKQIPWCLKQLCHKITDIFLLDPRRTQTNLNFRCFQITGLDLFKERHIDCIFRIVFRKGSCDFKFLSHVARKVFVSGFPFVIQRVHKDNPSQFLGQLRFGLACKLHHIGNINLCLFPHRYRQRFTCRINACYNLGFLDGALGEHIRFSLQIALMVNHFQGTQQTIAVVRAERPFIGTTAEKSVFLGVIVIELIELALHFRNLGITTVI